MHIKKWISDMPECKESLLSNLSYLVSQVQFIELFGLRM